MQHTHLGCVASLRPLDLEINLPTPTLPTPPHPSSPPQASRPCRRPPPLHPSSPRPPTVFLVPPPTLALVPTPLFALPHLLPSGQFATQPPCFAVDNLPDHRAPRRPAPPPRSASHSRRYPLSPTPPTHPYSPSPASSLEAGSPPCPTLFCGRQFTSPLCLLFPAMAGGTTVADGTAMMEAHCPGGELRRWQGGGGELRREMAGGATLAAVVGSCGVVALSR